MSYPGQLYCCALVNSAMIKINLLKNSIGTDQAEAFGGILASHPTLKSLCGLDSDATEADFSNQGLESDDAILIVVNSPLRTLNISDNNLTQGKSRDNDGLAPFLTDMAGVVALAEAIKDS